MVPPLNSLLTSSGPQGGHLSILAHYAGQKWAAGIRCCAHLWSATPAVYTQPAQDPNITSFILRNLHLRHIIHDTSKTDTNQSREEQSSITHGKEKYRV